MLLVGLAIGILSWSTTERAAASGFRAEGSARQLANTAVSLVQAQINLATTQGSTVSWASQPGMVRTFDTNGNLLFAYKLYSASKMVFPPPTVGSNSILSGGSFPDVPPAAWASDPAVWTDLNEPVTIGNVVNYPILNPGANATGYSVTGAPVVNANYQPVPMPVQWLYQLRDGTLVSPTDAGSGSTTTVAGASSNNPIVGRIAFWTDDDTCKVNVNTAGEGTYWDTPRACSVQEESYAQYQPAQNEFQRYPGHPATTCLSTVFPQFTTEQIYGLVPRIVGGGSTEGTVIPSGALTPDSDRLYADIDELLFSPTRGSNPPAAASPLTKANIQQAKFFLTAKSRAPETNLFNLPRVAIWPLYNGLVAANTTAYDQLVAFCSSYPQGSGRAPYYFQRQNPTSSTVDIGITRNTQLYSYLQYLTGQSIPSVGGNSFLQKYGDDRDQILTEIFDYVRCANLNDAGLAATKTYTPTSGTGQGWVVPTLYTATPNKPTMGFGRTYTLAQFAIGFICNADATDTSLGSNDPTKNAVLGGTALTGTKRYIQAVIVPEFFSPMQGWIPCSPNLAFTVSGLGGLTVTDSSPSTSNLFPNLDGPSTFSTLAQNLANGMVWWGGNPCWRWFGLSKGSPARGHLPADSTATTAATTYPFIGNPIIVTPSAANTMAFSGGNVTVSIYASPTGTTPGTLIQTVALTLPPGVFPVPKLVPANYGTNPTLQGWWSYSSTGQLSGVTNGRLNYINFAENNGGTFFYPYQFSFTPSTSWALTDVTRSVLPSHGDYRLVAANPNLTDTTVFAPHPYYNDLTTLVKSTTSPQSFMHANSLGSDDGQNLGSVTGYDPTAKYISSLSYPLNIAPDIPSNAVLTPQATGDIDNGVSATLDGPYINKPDEGNTLSQSSGNIPYFGVNWQQAAGGNTFFSPDRQMPSPGMFGSLSTGVKAAVPWRTLLFRSQPGHFGATTPEDRYLLDLFWMPVIEPYAISDCFSTAGKINMNYQILPFTYITRSTGMNAVLKGESVGVIPNSAVSTYKPNTHLANWTPSTTNYRLLVDIPTTLSQFDSKFAAGDIFKSASEICDEHIVPQTSPAQTVAGMSAFWASNALTGDNLRERVYTTVYPRVTTKSNTYTVHFRAQALKKAIGTNPSVWTEGTDVVTGEYRGSTTIERFINPANTSIPDYAADAAAGTISADPTLDTFYKWHIIEDRQFAP